MTLNVKLSPQAETWITGEAQRLGVPPAEVVRRLVDRQAATPLVTPGAARASETNHFYFTASEAEFDRALDSLADLNEGAPALPEEAFDRECLYEDRL